MLARNYQGYSFFKLQKLKIYVLRRQLTKKICEIEQRVITSINVKNFFGLSKEGIILPNGRVRTDL